MKKLKNLRKTLSLIAISAVLVVTSSTIQARELIKKQDMFTFENILNVYESDTSREYMVSVEGTVYGRGGSVYGIDPTGPKTTDIWEPIIIDNQNTPITDVVSIDLNSNGELTMVTDKGKCYIVSSSIKVATLYFDSDITEAPSYSSSSYSQSSSIHSRAWGYAYIKSNNSIGISFKGSVNGASKSVSYNIESRNGANFVKSSAYSNYNSSYPGGNIINWHRFGALVLDELGNLSTRYFTWNTSYDSEYIVATNIKDFYHNGDLTAKILSNLGNLSEIHIETGSTKSAVFYKDGELVHPVVDSIISDDECYGGLIVNTNLGYFSGSISNMQYNEELQAIKPVTASPLGLIAQDGNYYKRPSSNANSGFIKEELQEWQNDNPIVPDTMLASFNIEPNKIFRRHETFPIEFSMITNKQPTAFNLYYGPISSIADNSTWIPISLNIPISEFDTSIYDIDIINSYGEKITGTTYTYNWEVGDNDLTNIQLVAEPVY